MRLHRDDFEMLKVIGRGAFGEVRNSVNPCCFFGMFYSAGKSPLNHCSLCHIIVFSAFLSFVFMTHFVCPTKTPNYQSSIHVPLKHLISSHKPKPLPLSWVSLLSPCQFPRDLGLALDCYSWAGTNLGILYRSFVLQGNVLLVPALKHLDCSLHAQCTFLFFFFTNLSSITVSRLHFPPVQHDWIRLKFSVENIQWAHLAQHTALFGT